MAKYQEHQNDAELEEKNHLQRGVISGMEPKNVVRFPSSGKVLP